MLSFIICLPTYNEKENTDTLIPKLLDIFDDNKLSGSILVIDDSSPDGTADIVREWQEKDSRVSLLLRKGKEGLGKAYIAGFKEAFKRNPDLIKSIKELSAIFESGNYNLKKDKRLNDYMRLTEEKHEIAIANISWIIGKIELYSLTKEFFKL